MANFSATLRRIVIALNGNDGPEYFQAGDSLCKPGMIVEEDDADEVKVCTTTGKPIGVVGCDADHDLGTVYTAGERIPIWMLGCGVDIYVRFQFATTITLAKGVIAESQGGDTTMKGSAMTKTAYVAHTTDSADATGRVLTAMFWIGHIQEAGSILTAVASDTGAYVPVRLSL